MRIFAIISILLFQSCLSNSGLSSAGAAEKNVNRLQDLRFGMSEADVFQIMHYPDKEEQFIVDDTCYDVWFYITSGMMLEQSAPVHSNLTPLVFKDGVYVGKGYTYYYKVTRPPETPKPKASESEPDLQKALEPPVKAPTAPSQKQPNIPAPMQKPQQTTQASSPMQEPLAQQDSNEDQDLENILNSSGKDGQQPVSPAPQKGKQPTKQKGQQPSSKSGPSQPGQQPPAKSGSTQQGQQPPPKSSQSQPGQQPPAKSGSTQQGQPPPPKGGQSQQGKGKKPTRQQGNQQQGPNPQGGPLQSKPEFEDMSTPPKAPAQQPVSAASKQSQQPSTSKQGSQEDKNPPKKKADLDEEDRKFLDDEQDEDFDYW